MDEAKKPLPLDLITCIYMLVSGCLAGLWGRSVPGAAWICPLFIAGGLASLWLPPLLRRSGHPLLIFLAAWYPVPALAFFYLSTARLNQGSPVPVLDPWLADWERDFFGGLVCERFSETCSSTLFAEIMAFFYYSYYIMIPGLGLLLWFRNKRLFPEFIFCTAMGFYVFYLIFAIAPSHGPQFHVNQGAILWDGHFFGPLLTNLLSRIEVPTGAFPSSHVGMAVVVTAFAWRHHRGLGLIAALLTAGLSAAILYGAPHYFLDLPCGIALGLVYLIAYGPLARKLGNRSWALIYGSEIEKGETNPDLR
jgi:hypothetical protein